MSQPLREYPQIYSSVKYQGYWRMIFTIMHFIRAEKRQTHFLQGFVCLVGGLVAVMQSSFWSSACWKTQSNWLLSQGSFPICRFRKRLLRKFFCDYVYAAAQFLEIRNLCTDYLYFEKTGDTFVYFVFIIQSFVALAMPWKRCWSSASEKFDKKLALLSAFH